MKKTESYISRRRALSIGVGSLAAIHLAGTRRPAAATQVSSPPTGSTPLANEAHPGTGEKMKIHYLEIVTPDVDAVCKLHSLTQGVEFGEAVQSLGGARTAKLKDGGMIGIRAPMHDGEKPVTRAYALVDDIEAAVAAAKEAGAEIAVPSMPIEGHGTCAIYFLGGIEAGFWQV